MFLLSCTSNKNQCGSRNATYYGKTKHYFKVRMCENLGILALAGKRVNSVDNSDIEKHLLFCNNLPDFDDCSIPTTNNNNFND